MEVINSYNQSISIGRHAFQTSYEYAADLSAFYDGYNTLYLGLSVDVIETSDHFKALL